MSAVYNRPLTGSRGKSPGEGKGQNRNHPNPWWTRRLLLVAGALGLVLGIAAYTIFSAGSLGVRPAENGGRLMADVTLATLDGEFRLSQYRGKVVALYFSFPG